MPSKSKMPKKPIKRKARKPVVRDSQSQVQLVTVNLNRLQKRVSVAKSLPQSQAPSRSNVPNASVIYQPYLVNATPPQQYGYRLGAGGTLSTTDSPSLLEQKVPLKPANRRKTTATYDENGQLLKTDGNLDGRSVKKAVATPVMKANSTPITDYYAKPDLGYDTPDKRDESQYVDDGYSPWNIGDGPYDTIKNESYGNVLDT